MLSHAQLALVRKKSEWRRLHSFVMCAGVVCVSLTMAGCAFAPFGKPEPVKAQEAPVPSATVEGLRTAETARPPQAVGDAAGTPTPRIVRSPQKAASRTGNRSSAQRKRVETKLTDAGPQPATPGPGVQPELREFVGAVGLIVKTLESANVAFNAPKSMTAGRAQPIHLVFGVPSSDDQLRATGDAPGEEVTEFARVSHRIEARLYGNSDFEISPVRLEERPTTGASDVARWQWHVKPLRDGNHELYLTVGVIADVRGQTIRRTETFQRQVFVEVTPWPDRVLGFAKDHWQWLWAGMAMPLIGWIWGRQRKASLHPDTGRRIFT